MSSETAPSLISHKVPAIKSLGGRLTQDDNSDGSFSRAPRSDRVDSTVKNFHIASFKDTAQKLKALPF